MSTPPYTLTAAELGARLARARRRADLTIPQAGEATGIDAERLSRLEGGRPTPNALELGALCHCYDLDPWEALAVADHALEALLDHATAWRQRPER